MTRSTINQLKLKEKAAKANANFIYLQQAAAQGAVKAATVS